MFVNSRLSRKLVPTFARAADGQQNYEKSRKVYKNRYHRAPLPRDVSKLKKDLLAKAKNMHKKFGSIKLDVNRSLLVSFSSVLLYAYVMLSAMLQFQDGGRVHGMKSLIHHVLKHHHDYGGKKYFLGMKGILVPIPIPMKISVPSIKLPSISFDKGDSGGGGGGGEKVKYIPVPVPTKGGGGGGKGWSGGGGGWSGGGGGWPSGGSDWNSGGGGGDWNSGGGGGDWNSGGGGWASSPTSWSAPTSGKWREKVNSDWKEGGKRWSEKRTQKWKGDSWEENEDNDWGDWSKNINDETDWDDGWR